MVLRSCIEWADLALGALYHGISVALIVGHSCLPGGHCHATVVVRPENIAVEFRSSVLAVSVATGLRQARRDELCHHHLVLEGAALGHDATCHHPPSTT